MQKCHELPHPAVCAASITKHANDQEPRSRKNYFCALVFPLTGAILSSWTFLAFAFPGRGLQVCVCISWTGASYMLNSSSANIQHVVDCLDVFKVACFLSVMISSMVFPAVLFYGSAHVGLHKSSDRATTMTGTAIMFAYVCLVLCRNKAFWKRFCNVPSSGQPLL